MEIIDVGFGYMMKPITFKTEDERKEHLIKQRETERRWCEMYGLDYEEVLRKREGSYSN